LREQIGIFILKRRQALSLKRLFKIKIPSGARAQLGFIWRSGLAQGYSIPSVALSLKRLFKIKIPSGARAQLGFIWRSGLATGYAIFRNQRLETKPLFNKAKTSFLLKFCSLYWNLGLSEQRRV